jgi:hypothetical protein
MMPTEDNGLAGARWLTSSRSNGGGDCVEVAFLDRGEVAVRDTKDGGAGPVLRFTRTEWAAFIDGARDGEFTQPA